MPVGRGLGHHSGYDGRRAIYSVVAWIVILVVGYWLVTDWQALPHLASSLMATVR